MMRFYGVLPLVDYTPTLPPGLAEKLSELLGYVAGIGGVACLVALMVGGIIIVLNGFGRAGDHAERIVSIIGSVFLGALMITGASGLGWALIPV